MRFWIITSRILQNHLFWDADLSQCGKRMNCLGLKTVKQVLLSGGGRRVITPGWRMDRGDGRRGAGSSQLTAFQKMTYSLQDKLDYVGMHPHPHFFYGSLCRFIQRGFKARCCSFCIASHVRRNKLTSCRGLGSLFLSQHSASNQRMRMLNWITGPLWYGHCQSQHVVSQERMMLFVLHHVLWLLVTRLAG